MAHPAFELVRTVPVQSLNLEVQEYHHRGTGARHYHLRADDSNNAFLVALRTVPHDSTGVAHILEHTSLCGSERYPVRDPFFMMIRRSLNTFMNAFTASDWTAYPFASKNRKDFDNLLDVYLDAVFFPRLDPLDFAQEGHRVEFADPNDPDAELVFKGVVFNEMKGAMSSPVSQVWQTLQSNLYPTTTYHYNSGGDPQEIPNLTYEQLKQFHTRHYHPSNAVFMTYGSFPVDEHQQRIDELALTRFESQVLDFDIPDEQRYPSPVALESSYTLDAEEDTKQKTHVVLGWLLGKSAELRDIMDAHLLSGVLLDNSASPLRQALETTDLGTAPSELCGLDDSPREAAFACGLEGCEPDRAAAVERLILDVLGRVAEDGVPLGQVESVLHQLELSQREVGGGSFPYGLQLMVRALPASLHGGDPLAMLNIDAVLTSLREEIKDPGYIKGLTRRLLLDNPHRVRLTMAPDAELSAQRAARESERLAEIKERLDEAKARLIVEQAAALKARQETDDDPELLPRVGLDDVPRELQIPGGREDRVDGMSANWFAQATNGLVYQQIVVDLPQIEADLLDDLPLFCEFLAEVGCGELDYLEAQSRQAAVTGGIGARTSVRARLDDVQRTRGVFVLSGKALARNERHLTEVLAETFDRARFDELPRLRELVAQTRAHDEAGITDRGHVYALTAACAGMGPCGALANRWDGLEAIKQIKTLDDALNEDEALRAFAARLERLRDSIVTAPRQTLVVSEEGKQADIHRGLEQRWAMGPTVAEHSPFVPDAGRFVVNQGWSTNTQVNFCAKAFPAVAQGHADAPALTVLGPFLRNGFLHRAIREQGGAYGAGASFDPDSGAFRFFSYRDPRLVETLADFDRAVEWLHSESHRPRALEEAILGVIGDIDRPESPAGEAIAAFFGALHGRTSEQRRRYRQSVLEVTLDDLKRVAKRYLSPSAANIAVVSDAKTLERHADLGFDVRTV